MRHWFVAPMLLMAMCTPVFACQLVPPSRLPTLSEMIGGLEQIYGGTVIGYRTSEGTELLGPIPSRCLDEYGHFAWWEWDGDLPSQCKIYLDTEAALFRVDVPVVGPEADDTAAHFMTWGDGDCNIDFEIGTKWLIAGHWFTQELKAPIRQNEIDMLRRLAARPAFDFKQLYR